VLYNFPIEYAIWRAHINQEGLKLSRTHKLMVYGDYVLEVNHEKTKYVFMSYEQKKR